MGCLLAAHIALLAWGAAIHSPTWDEPGHLASGIGHWKFGTFRLYHVNPPLVRMVAALPVLAVKHETDWNGYSDGPYSRPEFVLGRDFVRANGQNIFRLITLARLACIPFSVLGALVCWYWARSLYGTLAGVVALSLWSFCPNILANGQLITPDMAGISFGLFANYLFWRWLRDPAWRKIPLLGLVFGLTQLTKSTWILLFGLWPLIWLVWIIHCHRNLWSEVRQLAGCFLIGIYVVNLGYGFSGSLTKLGDYDFLSHALGSNVNSRVPGNRFRGTVLQHVPIPLPRDYVAGIDSQKYDFDRGMRSYLRGTWKDRGWWYYYLYGLAIKVPLGTWLIILLAAVLPAKRTGYAAEWRDEAMVLVPALAILVFVSSQTGFSHHLRYVLPSFPFIYIWASKVARSVELRAWPVTVLAAVGLAWSVGSSLWVYPHSLSYFNELVGGPKGGHWHLGNSNTDWGQDLLLIKQWYDKHPEAQPFHLAYAVPHIAPEFASIEWQRVPSGPVMHHPGSSRTKKNNSASADAPSAVATGGDVLGPAPGWFALSVNKIHRPNGEYEYFLEFEPVAIVGYSTYIYHITLSETNRLRRQLGLPELSEPTLPVEGPTDDPSPE